LRDKHIHISRDSAILKHIYKAVDEQLIIDSKKTSRLLCMKFAVYALLTAGIYALLYLTGNPFLLVGCFVAYGFMALLLAFNFAHDLSHGTVFANKKWNEWGFIAIYAMNGAHAEAWKQRHIHSHHYAPNVEDYDSDLQISSLIRVIPGSKHSWYHRLQHIYAPLAYTTYSLYWIFIKDIVILFSKDEYTSHKGLQYHLSFWLQKLFYFTYLLVLPLLFSGQPVYVILIGLLSMHLLQSLFLLLTFFMTHHVESTEYPETGENGYINTSWLMNQVKSSNDMHPFSRTANFILGGFNNHIAHHLFPHIHHIHYPRLSRILYDVLEQYDITPNETTYVGGIASHLRLLKKMSKKEEELPRPPAGKRNNSSPHLSVSKL
jgi:linoleoyl-CoA desaturase